MLQHSGEYWALDRFEEGIALLVSDSGETRRVQFEEPLPKEGSVFICEGCDYIPDPAETQRRWEEANALMTNIFKK